MSKKKESLNKKNLNQVAGGGPSRGKTLSQNPLYQNPNFIEAFRNHNAVLSEQGKPLINIKEFAEIYYPKILKQTK